MSSARIKEIEEQLSHLKWRRLQNDRAIKASLEASQSMLQKDSILQMSVDRAGDRAVWLGAVVHDELSRPLVIDDGQMCDLIQSEKSVKHRLEQRNYSHLDALRKAKKTIRHRPLNESDKAEKLHEIRQLEHKIRYHTDELKDSAPMVVAKWAPPLPT